MAVGGDHTKPFLHRGSSRYGPIIASCFGRHDLARVRAERKKIRTNPLIFLDSVSEIQRIAAKYDAPDGNSLLAGNSALLKNSPARASTAASGSWSFVVCNAQTSL
jgi:hypothetical protein